MMKNSAFKQIQGQTFLSAGPVNVGVIDTDDGVILVDSGNDKDAGRRLLKGIRESGRSLKAVVNTHSNADHIGGNAYLKNNGPAQIWAPRVETAFIEDPVLEPSFLWGGFPFKQLRSKFFMAKPSVPDRIIGEDEPIDGLQFILLPGHFFGQCGVITQDRVFFLGDSLFGAGIIEKYGLPFIYDVAAYCSSIEKIKAIEADFYVPSHGDVVTDIGETAALNLQTVDAARRDILTLIGSGCCFEDLLKAFCDLRGLCLDHGQYVLVGSTLKSFLAWLCDAGQVQFVFEGNRMIWQPV